MMGRIFGSDEAGTREEARAGLAKLPPIDPADVSFAVANAGLLDAREDYVSAIGEVYDATAYGRRQMFMRYGIGAAIGVTLGVIVGKYVL